VYDHCSDHWTWKNRREGRKLGEMARRALLILIVALAVGLALGVSILLVSASALYSAVTTPPPTPTLSPANFSERLDLHIRPDGQAEVTANSTPPPTG
jgi:hypothetical protein